MGKNHRHTKKLKSERNKVQIKSKTKFLPKGQNVTNTAFKIKSIVLQEQLKDRQPPSLSISKANVEELISKLRHHNDSLKIESCQKLKDWINFQPLEVTRTYLCSIIQVSSALIQDRETKVREAYIKLMGAILEKASINTIRPHFNYVLANFKCAMTNISKYIQEDSLLFLDAVLEHQPTLIGENFEAIFPNFLSLISKLKTHTNERSLTLNLEGKVSSTKWRIKVLTRLYGILKAVNQFARDRMENNDLKPIVANANDAVYVPIFKNITHEDCGGHKNKSSEFYTQLPVLAKLLDEIWMEVVPKRSGEPTVLTNEESIAIFSCIVHVLQLIYELIEISHNRGSTLSTNFQEIVSSIQLEQLLDHLMLSFPYRHNKGGKLKLSKQFMKHFSVKPDPNFVEENLIIIYIFLTLRLNSNVKHHRNASAIGAYLSDVMTLQNHVTHKSVTYLAKIMQILVLKSPSMCQKIGAKSGDLVESLDQFCSARKIPQDVRSDVYQILATSSTWVGRIPELLCTNPVSAKLIRIAHELVLTSDVLSSALRHKLSHILKHLPDLVIAESDDLELSTKLLVYMFYYVPKLKLRKISEFVERFPNLSSSKYFTHVLDARQ